MNKIIVTGSHGFIGQHLVKRLRKEGHEVICIDRKIGIDAIDIENYIDGVDVVFHLAAQTSVFNEDKQQILYDNYAVFMCVCDTCSKHNIKLVYASSSCSFNITSLYGMSKRFNEDYAAIYNDNSIGVRFYNVYGKNQRPGTLFYNLQKGHCKIYNNGNNKRHFTYIDDIIDGLLKCITLPYKIVNIVNPEYISVNQFITEMRKFVNITNIEYIDKVKKFDKIEQYIDQKIYTIPLKYKTVNQGMYLIFSDK